MAMVYPAGINGVLTTHGQQLLLAALFKKQLSLEDLWMALLWETPSDVHDGVTMPEVQGAMPDYVSGLEVPTGYSRAYYSATDATGRLRWDQSSSRSVYNSDQILFPAAEAPWGQIRGWAAVDAQQGGRLIAVGLLDLQVDVGDQVVIEPGSLGFVVLTGV